MLEALQDIEIASRLVGFDGDDDESLDQKYEKLRCGIAPLPRDSQDYQLVEKYLLNTHASTHKVLFFFQLYLYCMEFSFFHFLDFTGLDP